MLNITCITLFYFTANSRNQLPRSQLQYIKELGTGYFGKVGLFHVEYGMFFNAKRYFELHATFMQM